MAHCECRYTRYASQPRLGGTPPARPPRPLYLDIVVDVGAVLQRGVVGRVGPLAVKDELVGVLA